MNQIITATSNINININFKLEPQTLAWNLKFKIQLQTSNSNRHQLQTTTIWATHIMSHFYHFRLSVVYWFPSPFSFLNWSWAIRDCVFGRGWVKKRFELCPSRQNLPFWLYTSILPTSYFLGGGERLENQISKKTLSPTWTWT